MNIKKFTILKHRYQLTEKIGEGKTREVYLAKDKGAGYQLVVVKRLKMEVEQDKIKDVLGSFEQEYLVLSGLNHPNIPRIFDLFEDDNDFYIIEEYIKGELLSNQIHGLMPYQAVKFILQICDVLEYLNKREITYRDLNPDNIMIGVDGRIALIDFGISRIIAAYYKNNESPGKVAKGYTLPEGCNDAQSGESADVYCMCALLHQLLTERDPAETETFEPPHKIDRQIPGDLSKVVMKGLGKDPGKRYQTIKEFREALFNTRGFKKKLISYQQKLDKRDSFFIKEEPLWVFSKFRKTKIRPKLRLIILGMVMSALLAIAVYQNMDEPKSFLPPVIVFLLTNVIFFLASQVQREGFKKLSIYESGLLYEGYQRQFSSLWDDVYALKLNISGPIKKLTVVTLNGDFEFDENLQAWDQVMKEIQRRAKLKIRHDISGRHPEIEIFEKTS